MSSADERYKRNRQNFLPWEPRSPETTAQQQEFQDVLRRLAGATKLGPNCFIAEDAHVYTENFSLGANSYIAGGAILRGVVNIGSDSAVNPFAHIAGRVTIGDGVRIAGLAS